MTNKAASSVLDDEGDMWLKVLLLVEEILKKKPCS